MVSVVTVVEIELVELVRVEVWLEVEFVVVEKIVLVVEELVRDVPVDDVVVFPAVVDRVVWLERLEVVVALKEDVSVVEELLVEIDDVVTFVGREVVESVALLAAALKAPAADGEDAAYPMRREVIDIPEHITRTETARAETSLARHRDPDVVTKGPSTFSAVS